MTDNVIILGAGASVDAGIPLLANFVDKMWDLATRGIHNDKELSDEDKTIFKEAMNVRNELDSYHGRASFDDRNIEDILSILTFSTINGKRSDLEKLNWIIKAITRTIELTCTIKHDGRLNVMQKEGPYVYRYFWQNLFGKFQGKHQAFPSIISFNYDLVLERALFQVMINVSSENHFDFRKYDGMRLNYHFKYLQNLSYAVKMAQYEVHGYDSFNIYEGTKLDQNSLKEIKRSLDIEILKLHGSLNFPSKALSAQEALNPLTIVNKPYIVPPIINKWISKDEQVMWGIGLKRLREAKNIIIVGYSLPQTDIYMQYFLKAGVGPNTNLNKIFVFNPVLYQSGAENDLMRERFGNCFSPQLRNRLEFRPTGGSNGTFSEFVGMINDGNLFFI